ncbi:MAG: TlpA family protein disulfide reductase [Deltaproteobacteria bacterium]|nr:TlpA family protein disulfide reductase [Deltaproteobacteria bacterium]
MKKGKCNIVSKNSFILLFVFILCLFSVSLKAAPGVGDMAMDFDLRELGGEKKYSLSDFKGQVILLNIWASWCSGCKEEMPHFIYFQQLYNKADFLIVAASVDRKEEDSLKFLKKLEKKAGREVNFLVLMDEDKKIAKDYNPFGLPASYLIDGEGKIIKSFYGSLKESSLNDLKAKIENLVKEK